MVKDLKSVLALNLKMFRLEKGLKQKELADLIGVSNKRFSNWERGLSMPNKEIQEKICNVLGITLDDLTADKEEASFKMRYDEFLLLSRFNNLDSDGKKFVLDVIKHEEERIANN